MTLSLTEQLVEQLADKPIADKDRQRAFLHLLDWLGCATLGAKSDVGRVFADSLLTAEPSGQSHSLATAIWQGNQHWQDALAYNAALGNILEMDDIHRSSILHPGPVVIPSALVVAQLIGANFSQLLDAIVKGYEVTIRLGESIGRSHYRYFHNTSSCAVAGACIAASHLWALSQEQQVWALGNCLSRTGGLWQMRNESVMTKQWHNAEAARSGVMAALMGKRGLRGPSFILEGEQGMFNALSDDADEKAFIANYDNWRLYDCSFKPWPACRHAHPAIDVITNVVKQQHWQPFTQLANHRVPRISAIEVHCYKDAKVFCDRPQPTSELQAKFSIQHAVAVTLLWGEPTLEHFKPEIFNCEQVKQVAQLVTLVDDEQLEDDYPQHYGAGCRITLENGTDIQFRQRDTLGDPECPLSTEQVLTKAQNLMETAGIHPSAITQLCEFPVVGEQPTSAFTRLFNCNTGIQ